VEQSEIKTGVEKITPHYARFILEKSDGFENRPLSMRTINAYADVMRRGKWLLNGEAIVIDVDGRCIDGQHRLWAVVESNASVDMVVVRGVETRAFSSIDQGKRRSAGDVLAHYGHQNRNTLAAVSRLVHGFVFERMTDLGTITNDDVLKTVTEIPTVVNWADYSSRISKAFPTASGIASAGVIVELFETREQWNDHASFFESIATGEMLRYGDPVMALREKLLRSAVRSGVRGHVAMYLTLRAWAATISNERLTKMVLPKEGFNQKAWDSVDPRRTGGRFR